jgi:hypothetical protein
MTPSQSPGQLVSDYMHNRYDRLTYVEGDSTVGIANEFERIYRVLDSLSTGKPETGIPVSEQDERLKVAVRALERLAAGDNMGVMVPTEDSPKHVENFQRVAQTALSRIKAMSND